MFKRFVCSAVITIGLVSLAHHCTVAEEISEVEFISHDITIELDVPAHTAIFTDECSVDVDSGWNYFQLAPNAALNLLALNGKSISYSVVYSGETYVLPEGFDGNLPVRDSSDQAQLVLFESDKSGQAKMFLEYDGEFYQDVSDTRFSNETVGKEISATIDEKGAYFSSEAYYYPVGCEESARFKLTAYIPQEWESISDGNLLASEVVDDRKQQTWENPYESDGLTFFAAPFVVGRTQADSVDIYCYFFAEDSSLMENYLNASANYIRMYSELIGPYPYERFTVVENFFPTGYGMPGWTLLGQQVLRLPFIVSTSLGHEVLHNWWGNSVFVDYSKGNWCEGITVYGADYRYKLMISPDEARDYRKNILKQYVSYINEGNDFPLREFTSRSDPSTRTIGYNKAMMVFHMIEELIGTDAFFDAWKKIYAEKKGQKVSWEDWIAAFEATSGADLSYILPEWVDRPGAPVLAVELDGSKFKLEDISGQDFHLKVPVRVSLVPLGGAGATQVRDYSISLEKGRGWSILPRLFLPPNLTSGEIVKDVDPDYHIFRKLYPEEVEPVISAILGNPKKFLLDAKALWLQDERDALSEFLVNMTGDSTVLEPLNPEKIYKGYYPILIDRMADYFDNKVVMTDDSITIGGTMYPKKGHTFILTGHDYDIFEKFMTVLVGDPMSLPRIGQLIPHYGKYSYLVFEGAKNVGKGQWEPESSPLRIKSKLVVRY